MLSTHLLAKTLRKDFPAIKFEEHSDFYWSPNLQTVYFDKNSEPAFLLHELSHALLKHTNYKRDIELLELERAAWEYAKVHLAPSYDISISDDLIEDSLDTYRDWLHARSLCPHCQATGVQIKQLGYRCIACHYKWRVNEARQCGLKRYLLTN